MKKRLMNNLELKLASLGLAIVVWLLVVYLNDPIVSRTFDNIPVEVTNGTYVESMNKTYQLEEGHDVVNVTVKGNRSVVDPLTADRITAVADMTQIVDIKSDPIMVPVQASCIGIASNNVTTNPGNIEITLEEMESKDFVITPTPGDTKPARGYEVGTTPQVTPEKMTITGPVSIINKIGRVAAPIDVTGISKDQDMQSTIEIYDKNDEKLTDNQMSYLKFGTDKIVDVHVTLYKVLTEVPVTLEYTGRVRKGYQVASITMTPNTISLVGSDAALEQFQKDGGVLTIPSDAIDASGESSDFETSVDIAQYLPENLRLAADANSTVLVMTSILPLDSKAFDVPTAAITQTSLSADRGVVFTTNKIQVRVKGTEKILESMTSDDIKASINLSNVEVGTYDMPVTITLPEGCELVEDVTVNIQVVDKTLITSNG
ncbi:MAG: CdaR family protein [Lachnospiraceae bacterium]|nr:CdaR family protein [Lachnospiraceae bacterium]